MLILRLTIVEHVIRGSVRDLQNIEGRGEKDTTIILLNLIAPQTPRQNHLNLTATPIQIYRPHPYHPHLIVVHQVVISVRRERDLPGKTGIREEKGRIDVVTEGVRSARRD